MYGDIQNVVIMDNNGKKITPLLVSDFGSLNTVLLKLYLDNKEMEPPYTVYGEWGENYVVNYGEPFTIIYSKDEMDDLRVFGRIL